MLAVRLRPVPCRHYQQGYISNGDYSGKKTQMVLFINGRSGGWPSNLRGERRAAGVHDKMLHTAFPFYALGLGSATPPTTSWSAASVWGLASPL